MNRFVRTVLTPAAAMITFGATGSLHAQTMTPDCSEEERIGGGKQIPSHSTSQIKHIKVVGHLFNTLHAAHHMGCMPQDVLHTAQTIDVVPKELMQQQNSKSLISRNDGF